MAPGTTHNYTVYWYLMPSFGWPLARIDLLAHNILEWTLLGLCAVIYVNMGFWHSLLVRDYYPLRYSPGGHGINHSSFRYQLVYQTMIPYPNVSSVSISTAMIPYPNVSSVSISTAISHSITIPRGINALFASNTLTEGDEDNKTPWILSEMWELVVAVVAHSWTGQWGDEEAHRQPRRTDIWRVECGIGAKKF